MSGPCKSPEEFQAGSPWKTVRDEETGAAILCPPKWKVLQRPEARIILRCPVGRGVFAPNVVVTVERPDEPLASDIEAYSREMLVGLHQTLTDLTVISDGPYLWYDLTGRHLLSAHRVGRYPVVLSQYWFLRDGLATVVSASCDVSDHRSLDSDFDYMVAGLSLATRLPEE